jgi:hypothetical protein
MRNGADMIHDGVSAARCCMPNRAPLLLALLCASFAANAQPLAPPPSLPPPPSSPPPPPPLYLPPPPPSAPPQAWVPTADLIARANALEALGRHKRRVGAALIASGSALVLAGGGLVIAGAWHGDHSCYGNGYYGYGYHSYYDGCGVDALTLSGVTTAVLGTAALLPGLIEYGTGGSLLLRARRLRLCGGFCW